MVDQGSWKLYPCKLQVIEGARMEAAATIIGIDINEIEEKNKGKSFLNDRLYKP
jgi:hypothetical protein